jgi:cytochrome c554/c'-like protein
MARTVWGLLAAFVATFGAVRAHAVDLIGAEKCGACHQAQYQQWLTTGHATALARLTKVQQRDATCRACHTMSPASEDPALAGVQCESCHGAGKFYAPRYVMRDPDLAKLLNLLPVTEEQCAPCHAKDTPSVREFKFQDAIALVRHKPKVEKKTK